MKINVKVDVKISYVIVEEVKIMADELYCKLEFKVVCPKCLRIYVQPVPVVSKENKMNFKCKTCNIMLVRFESSK